MAKDGGALRPVVELLRTSRVARGYFAALAQSSLGTGAAAVAILLVAYDRFRSPWAVGLVLLADVVPAMVLGPVFGAAADRWPRRRAMVAADSVGAVAFAGMFFVDGFVPTLAFALLAGIGTGLFTPAALASLPSVSGPSRLPAATSLHGTVVAFGWVAGPGIAALFLLVGGPETVLAANAVTFALSALLLVRLDFGGAPADAGAESHPSLLREAREGLVATATMAGVRVLLAASAMLLLFAAIFNVGELLLATRVLDAGGAGFAVLTTLNGAGYILGSLSGSRGGTIGQLKHRYLAGSFLMAFGIGAAGLAPVLLAAAVAFVAVGYGNGLLLVYERQLIQATVPDSLAGRVFGVKDALTAWAFAFGFLVGPPLLATLGTRSTVALAGAGGLLVWMVSALALRRVWTEAAQPSPARLRSRFHAGSEITAGAGPGEKSPHLVGRSGVGPGILDDSD
jgi:MFS family permease